MQKGIEKELTLEVTCHGGHAHATWRVTSFRSRDSFARIDDSEAITSGTEFLAQELLRLKQD